MRKPLVSILMSAYNAEGFIQRAIESALGQTYSRIELVIVNDGSTDRTEDKIRPYLKDTRVIYYRQNNQGVSRARNHAFRLSHGDYIAFLDPDDFYHPEKVEREADFLEGDPQCGAVYCRFASFSEDKPGKFFRYQRPFPHGDILKPLMRWNLINPNVIMIRRGIFEAFGGFDSDFRDAEDWDLWLRMAARGIKFGFLDRELHYNCLRPGSHSRFENQYLMKLSNVRSFERIFSQFSEGEKRKHKAENILRRARLKVAVAYLVIGRKDKFREYLHRATRGSPWFLLYPLFAFGASIVPKKILSQFIVKAWKKKQEKLLGIS